MKDTIKVYGLEYKLPRVKLAHITPLGISEFAARTCYNSFDKSEHNSIKRLNAVMNCEGDISDQFTFAIKNVENEVNTYGSDLLHQLSHVYFHESTLEHIQANFFIKNTTRGVLQELARHRIANFSVQSTRYTMSEIINTFLAVNKHIFLDKNEARNTFIELADKIDFLITTSSDYNNIELGTIYDKILLQSEIIGIDKFTELTVAKSIIDDFNNSKSVEEAITILNSKAKRNVGDVVKHIVTDNFTVDLAFSINLRSLKNFLDLRLSGAAYWQIQLLAAAIYEQIPEKYLELVVKNTKNNTYESIKERIEKGEW